jgi:hypothetical protein
LSMNVQHQSSSQKLPNHISPWQDYNYFCYNTIDYMIHSR